METIDRAAVIVTPKKPFYDWANSLDPQGPISEEELDEKETVYLVPERDSNEQELFSWYMDETSWPADLSYTLFREWFDVKICSMVFDLEEGAILKESASGEE